MSLCLFSIGTFGPIHKSVSVNAKVNAAMTPVIQLSLKSTESFQNGLKPHFSVTPIVSIVFETNVACVIPPLTLH